MILNGWKSKKKISVIQRELRAEWVLKFDKEDETWLLKLKC